MFEDLIPEAAHKPAAGNTEVVHMAQDDLNHLLRQRLHGAVCVWFAGSVVWLERIEIKQQNLVEVEV